MACPMHRLAIVNEGNAVWSKPQGIGRLLRGKPFQDMHSMGNMGFSGICISMLSFAEMR